jgi:Flp pilus assembly protein TadD
MTETPTDEPDRSEGLPGIIGHYRPVEKIGEGAMGNVYIATDLDIPGRKVALKILKPNGTQDLSALRREASALAALQHGHILVVHEIGEASEGPYLAMEYMRGESLAKRLKHGPLTTGEALRIGRDVADALRAAHEKNLVHRDVKPANLLLTEEGEAKLADFGLAVSAPPEVVAAASSMETTRSGAVPSNAIAGTPGYMAPEVLRGEGASSLTDQFALGVTLHEMLTRKHPFQGVTWPQMMVGPEPRLAEELPRDLTRLIGRCVAPNPGDRHPDMAKVVEGLERAIRRRDPTHRRLVRSLIGLAALLAVVATGWLGLQRLRAHQARILNEAGVAAFEAGNYEEAYRTFMAAHVKDSAFEPACNNLGMLSLSEGDAARAVTILEGCRESFPESAPVRAGLGRALREEGRLVEAESELESALSLDHRPEQLPLILNELALTLIDNEKAETAVSHLEQRGIPTSETLEGAILNKTLGLALLECGRPGDAVEALRRSLDGPLEGPVLGVTLVALGRGLEQTGDRPGARKAFSRALLSEPDGETEQQATAGLKRVSIGDRQGSLPD